MKAFDKLKSWLRKLGTEEEGEAQRDDEAILGAAASSSTEPSTSQPAAQQLVGAADNKRPPDQQNGPAPAAQQGHKTVPDVTDFFAEYGEANRYQIKEVVGKGSYGIVASAVDNFTGEKVAIKKITNVFEHVSDATRILREIKLLRMLKHPDIVDIKHIMLPPTRDYRDIYVVFELMETDLHQVIKANDDLTPEHHQFFLYQMLRGLKYIHSAKVFHRDLKPKNILANSDCKLKICDFGLARPAFNDMPTTIFWTDYVATRWYRAPELCGSFFAKYSPAIDLWSVGCIFAEVLLGKPLFAGRNVVHQLELITDLLGTPSAEVIAKVRNDKARRFLAAMRKKPPVPFSQHFPRAEPAALDLLQKLLAFDPAERPTSEEALLHHYFTGMHSPSREPVSSPISKMSFEFDRRKLSMEDVRELIYREILEYHPLVLEDHLAGNRRRSALTYPSALDNFKRQFMHLEAAAAVANSAKAAPETRAKGGSAANGATSAALPAARPQGGGAAAPPESAVLARTPSARARARLLQATSLPKEWIPDFVLDVDQQGRSRAGSVGGGLAAGDGVPVGRGSAAGVGCVPKCTSSSGVPNGTGPGSGSCNGTSAGATPGALAGPGPSAFGAAAAIPESESEALVRKNRPESCGSVARTQMQAGRASHNLLRSDSHT